MQGFGTTFAFETLFRGTREVGFEARLLLGGPTLICERGFGGDFGAVDFGLLAREREGELGTEITTLCSSSFAWTLITSSVKSSSSPSASGSR